MEQLGQTLIFGLATGGVIAVAAVGLTLSYGVTGFINFAYGELLTVGAFTTFALARAGLGLLPSAVLAIAVTGVVSLVIAGVFYEPLRGRGPLPLLITSIGVAFIAQNVVQIAFGASPQPFPVPLLRPWSLGPWFVPRNQAGILVVAVVCMLVIHALLRATLLGRKMRAAAGNDDLARLSGIDTRRVVRVTWLVSGLVAGVGGALLGAAQGTVRPTMGFSFLLVVFAATLLGGIGKPYGAMAGAVVIGVGLELGATYLSADYTYAVAFAALVGVLVFRPGGIFGDQTLAAEAV